MLECLRNLERPNRIVPREGKKKYLRIVSPSPLCAFPISTTNIKRSFVSRTRGGEERLIYALPRASVPTRFAFWVGKGKGEGESFAVRDSSPSGEFGARASPLEIYSGRRKKKKEVNLFFDTNTFNWRTIQRNIGDTNSGAIISFL